MFAIAVLIQSVWLFVPAAELNVIVLFGFTMIVSTRFVNDPPPEQLLMLIVKVNVPEIKGVPFNSIAPEFKLADNPLGNPQFVVSIDDAFVAYEIVEIWFP